LRRAAGPHPFHNKEAAADADYLLADAGGARGAGTVVDIEAGADERRIADAARKLVRQARGSTDAAEVALLVEGKNGDGVVVGFGGGDWSWRSAEVRQTLAMRNAILRHIMVQRVRQHRFLWGRGARPGFGLALVPESDAFGRVQGLEGE